MVQTVSISDFSVKGPVKHRPALSLVLLLPIAILTVILAVVPSACSVYDIASLVLLCQRVAYRSHVYSWSQKHIQLSNNTATANYSSAFLLATMLDGFTIDALNVSCQLTMARFFRWMCEQSPLQFLTDEFPTPQRALKLVLLIGVCSGICSYLRIIVVVFLLQSCNSMAASPSVPIS